jgi:hypothetical protein
MGRPWSEIRDNVMWLADFAGRIALWRNATATSDDSYDQSCRAAQVGAFLIRVMWQRLLSDVPALLKAFGTIGDDVLLPEQASKGGPAMTYDFDVAISYAGEDRPYVDRVAKCLRKAGVRVFYDQFATVESWGENNVDFSDDIYQTRARYCLMFVSEHYAKKVWPTFERRVAQARALVSADPYILPVRLDDTTLPGLLPSVIYIDGRNTSSARLCTLVQAKL